MTRLLVLFFIPLLIISRAFADDWTTYQHDAGHSGRSSANFDPLTLQKVWGAAGFGKPIVVGNSVYAIHLTTPSVVSVASLNLQTGLINWQKTVPGYFADTPSYSDGLIAVTSSFTSGLETLNIFDAATGVQKYVVNLPDVGLLERSPTLARNSNNQLVAYVAGANGVAAVSLGANSGNLLWFDSTNIGVGFSYPTVAGNSVIVAGPGHYVAIDQLTGAMNNFFSKSNSGGEGVTAVYDDVRKELYIRDGDAGVFTSFSYTSNSSITQKWQTTASGDTSVVIGPDGGVYGTTTHDIFEWSPDDGSVVNAVHGLQLSAGFTPAISGNSLFMYGDAGINPTTEVFNLYTLAHVTSLPFGDSSANTPQREVGAVFNGGYVLSGGGLQIYFAVPEPATATLLLLGMLGCGWRRRR